MEKDYRTEIVSLIKILGYPHSEVVCNITMSKYEISSLFYDKETDKVTLCHWYDEYEYQFDYDDLSNLDKKLVIMELRKYILN